MTTTITAMISSEIEDMRDSIVTAMIELNTSIKEIMLNIVNTFNAPSLQLALA